MLRQFRRVAVAFVGGIVVAVGVVMLVLPGPAILVIPAGLAILATEFHWARRLLRHVRKPVERGLGLFKRQTPTKDPDTPEASVRRSGSAEARRMPDHAVGPQDSV